MMDAVLVLLLSSALFAAPSLPDLLRVPRAPRWETSALKAVKELPEGTLHEWTVETGSIRARAYLLLPAGTPKAGVVVLHGHEGSPEQALGLAPGARPLALELAKAGLAVAVPEIRYATKNLKEETRDALLLIAQGKTLMGERAADALRWADLLRRRPGIARVGLAGWSMGGVISLYAAALDPKIGAVFASGAFGSLDRLLSGPLAGPDNYVPGILPFGGMAAVAKVICPRPLFLEGARGDAEWMPEDFSAGAEALRRDCSRRPEARFKAVLHDGPHRLVGDEAAGWLRSALVP